METLSKVRPLKILFASAEAIPFFKVGGLADVAGSLPRALTKLGHDVRLALPCYGMIDLERFDFRPFNKPFPVKTSGGSQAVSVVSTALGHPEVIVYAFKNERYLEVDRPYGEGEGERFIFFGLAVLAFLKARHWLPDLVHAHDWHTALLPTWLGTKGQEEPFYRGVATLFTIHNLAYQGTVSDSLLTFAGLNGVVAPLEVEDQGEVNWMAQGIAHADWLSTVSPRYAREILTPEFGCGLDPLLCQRRDRLEGIANGLDYDLWNPVTDPNLAVNYDLNSLGARSENKRALQEEAGLTASKDTPLVGMVSRLTEMKGFDIAEPVIRRLLAGEAQFVLLGTGQSQYQEMFRAIEAQYPTKAKAFFRYDDALARRIYAGSDIFLMPSRFEPCGQGQLIAMRYGSVPLVRATGGLADTVSNYDDGSGTGFLFEEYSPEAFWRALSRALELYVCDRKAWLGLQWRGMTQDLSWEASARKYEALCQKAIAISSRKG